MKVDYSRIAPLWAATVALSNSGKSLAAVAVGDVSNNNNNLAAAPESTTCSLIVSAPVHFASNGPTCFSYAELGKLAAGPFHLSDAYPMPYIVTSPCHNVTASMTNCTSFSGGDSAGAPAFAIAGANECYALGHLDQQSVSFIDPANHSAGVQVTYSGGTGGREMRYRFPCDPAASPDAGPEAVRQEPPEFPTGYEFTWPTPFSCKATEVLPADACAADIPLPTADQLLFQEMEMGALVCYQMATANNTQGCAPHQVPDAAFFNDVAPADIDTDGWCKAIASFGGKYATLVAKHECGFAIWDTKATVNGKPYNYSSTMTGFAHPPRDIVESFVESCTPLGVRTGIYYSVVSNSYLNVVNGLVQDPSTLQPGQVAVTQEQYADIVAQQLAELWGNYGDLAEIWFDGGFAVPGLQDRLLELLNETQPHAAIFNGCGLSPNAVAWIGSETGHSPYPLWNTQTGCPSGAGTVDGTSFVPKEVDLTLQNADTWFYNEGTGYRSLAEMKSIYHDSVGVGGNMLLNVAPPINSSLPDEAVATYAALGSWIRACYGEGQLAAPSSLATTNSPCVGCMALNLTLPPNSTVDRFLIKEDMRGGQRVVAFSILVDGEIAFQGSSIGRTLVALLPKPVQVMQTVQLRIDTAKAPPTFRLFAVPDPSSCQTAGI